MPQDTAIIDLANDRVKRMVIDDVRHRTGLHWYTLRRCRNQRSLQQNRFYWACIIPAAAEALEAAWGESITADEMHEFFKAKFLSKPVCNRRTGEAMGRKIGSTTMLDAKEFSEYVDRITKFCAEYLGAEMPACEMENELSRPPIPARLPFIGSTERMGGVGGGFIFEGQ